MYSWKTHVKVWLGVGAINSDEEMLIGGTYTLNDNEKVLKSNGEA